jgi:cell wall-associated NlpC family hydrolase
MNEMIKLHAETHGAEYWRELLAMTVREIVAEPNYTPQDLAAVRRPTLVVQGERDGVNAPARHAQFIAGHLPDAELWLPAGIGHNVHDELLFAWVERVLDFLRRRGDDDNEALYRLGRARYADGRDWIYDLRAERQGDSGRLTLAGEVVTGEQHAAARALFGGAALEDRVEVRLTEATPWALARWPVADLRAEPRSRAERISQAVFGEAVRILEERDEWACVRLERDGYLGWARVESLHRCDSAGAAGYAARANGIVVAELARAYAAPQPAERVSDAIGKLPFGASVVVEARRDGWVGLRRPDKQIWWCAAVDVLPLSERPRPDREGIEQVLALIRRFVGVPYLWGGRTPFGYDCSGLAQTFMSLLGIQVPRDADQQFAAGAPVEGPPQPGDLLFFGRPRDDVPGAVPVAQRRIVHVAISLGGDELIHANSDAGGVAYNSLDPGSPRFRAWLRDAFAGARRYV